MLPALLHLNLTEVGLKAHLPALLAGWASLSLAVLTVTRANEPPSDSNSVLPAGRGRDLVIRACVACHPATQIVVKARTRDEWDELIGKMVDRGARASDEEQAIILEYLVEHFGPDAAARKDLQKN
jgi:mono/diheme cytochrome c family protein